MRDIRVGDQVVQLNGGVWERRLEVVSVDDALIHCAEPGSDEIDASFCRQTGAEVDDGLGWGPPPRITGSYLVRRLPDSAA